MDKIQKFLNRLNSKEKEKLKYILFKLQQGQFHGLDLKKLTGHSDIFRIRKGDLQIIFKRQEAKTFLLSVERGTGKDVQRFLSQKKYE